MYIDFDKSPDGLVPAIVQDNLTGKVLMLGYMNRESFEQTRQTKLATFYSRSRRKLWIKGEQSGNFLKVAEIFADCDADTLLIKAEPAGAVCHTGAATCFKESNAPDNFLDELEQKIRNRKQYRQKDSYTAQLFELGLNKIAQKVGEEAVELIIEAKDDDLGLFKSEAADLLFHFLVLLSAKDVELKDIVHILKKRAEGKQ